MIPAPKLKPPVLILEDLGLCPPVVAVAHLPAKRRIVGIDAGAACNGCIDLDAHDQVRDVLIEPQVQRVAHLGWRRKREPVGPLRPCRPVRHRDRLELTAASNDVSRGHEWRDHECVRNLEDDRVVRCCAQRPDLRAPGRYLDGLVGRGGKPEADLRPGCRGPVQLDSEQLQERDVQLVGHAIEAVDEHVRHPCEQLDQGDPRIRDVVLGPLRTAERNPHARLRDDLLEAAVVQHDVRQVVHAVSSAGIT